MRALRALAPAAARELHAAASGELPLRTGRPRLVVLGTGWGGAALARDLDCRRHWDLTVVSPSNHMVFTPLLASCCVGTVEPRSVAVAVTDIQPALRQPWNNYFAARCVGVDFAARSVACEAADGARFDVEYDALCVATGSQGSTFGTPGVEEHALFLRDAAHAEAIRSRLMSNWLAANIPGRPPAERDRLLAVAVVGGGPTGVEFAGELADFVARDLARIDADRARDVRVTLVEATELLGSFATRLREYAARALVRRGVHLVRGRVAEVRAREVALRSGAVLPVGMTVWATGVGPTPFAAALPVAHTSHGRVAVDEFLRVLAPPPAEAGGGGGGGPAAERVAAAAAAATASDGAAAERREEAAAGAPSAWRPLPGVYALGDVCANPDAPLPALAQVAEQQGRWLAAELNRAAAAGEFAPGAAAAAGPPTCGSGPFLYRPLGSMASIGGHSAILQLAGRRPARGGAGGAGAVGRGAPAGGLRWAGFWSWVAWRSAYLTRLGSWKHRAYVAANWTTTLLFGRDTSRW